MVDIWLNSISVEPSKIKREAILRKRSYREQSVAKQSVQEHLQNGWEIDKELKTKTRIRKPWSHDERLENRVWYLFYLLGYPEISSGRNFQVTIVRKGANSYKKQIDVLAKDDETVIVTECKSSINISRRSLQKDIEEFANLKRPIADAIRKHYGSDYKPKIIWLFVTNNIAWSQPDRDRAIGSRINIVTEKELRYYLQIAEHLRSAARFQFLAEFLKNQKIPEMENISVPAVRGKLGGKTFFSFVSTPKQMLKISFVNHRSLNDPEGAPSYQRLVGRTRLRQISRFISAGGYFPTNILVNFTSQCRFDQIARDDENNIVFGHLYLPSKYRSAWIIDGQHRLYGYAPLSDKFLNQNIMVVAFVNLEKEEEANLFVTINHEQKSVPKTLLDDLEGELKWGSDRPSERVGAISARLIGLLNNDIGEPLYGRITQQGIRPNEKTCLTVPALKDGLRRSGLVGQAILRNREYSPGALCSTDDSSTLERSQAVLNDYFRLLLNANIGHWEAGRKGFICTNVSLQAYLLILRQIIEFMEQDKGISARELDARVLVEEIVEYLDPILRTLKNSSLLEMENKFKVQFGSGGPIEYFYRLCTIIQIEFPDFSPEGMGEWKEAQSEERVEDTDRKLKELNIRVQKAIFDVFRRKYGYSGDAYWNKGVVQKKIKIRAYQKSLDDLDEDRLPLENYLDFIEYKEIVENKLHWPMFRPLFDIPLPGEKGNAKNVKWMIRINELRRIPAHATEKRHYKAVDFEYIDYIYKEFTDRLNSVSIVMGDEE